MNKEEFIKQRCEIDKITEEEFEEQYRVVKCNCGQPYCKGYKCLDLDDLLEENQKLEQENKQLKDKLEFYSGLELNKTIDKTRLEYNKLQQENQKYKEVINKANKKLNNFIECCKAEKLESGSDYLHHEYWDMFERFNKQIKDILKEVK